MVESWDFPRSRLVLTEGDLGKLSVLGQLESAWIAEVTEVFACLRISLTWAVSSFDSESSSSLLDSLFSELSAEFVPLVGVSLKCTVLLLQYFQVFVGQCQATFFLLYSANLV